MRWMFCSGSCAKSRRKGITPHRRFMRTRTSCLSAHTQGWVMQLPVQAGLCPWVVESSQRIRELLENTDPVQVDGRPHMVCAHAAPKRALVEVCCHLVQPAVTEHANQPCADDALDSSGMDIHGKKHWMG